MEEQEYKSMEEPKEGNFTTNIKISLSVLVVVGIIIFVLYSLLVNTDTQKEVREVKPAVPLTDREIGILENRIEADTQPAVLLTEEELQNLQNRIDGN